MMGLTDAVPMIGVGLGMYICCCVSLIKKYEHKRNPYCSSSRDDCFCCYMLEVYLSIIVAAMQERQKKYQMD